jgi:methionyl aminopeptidase
MITIKSKKEIEIMREGAKMLSEVLRKVGEKVEPGITTKELDMAAESHILNLGAKPSFKGYQGYPATLCTSINEEIVHAIPSERKLKEGEIITLDIGLYHKGFHSDMAKTFEVGEVSPEVKRLVKVTKKSLKIGINKLRPGVTTGDVGNTIQRYVESQGFNIVRDLCGHGIGRELHEDPQILNYGKRRSGEKFKEGMVVCLEPMVVVGDWRIKKGEDGFAFLTYDNSLSAHFEHEIAITEEGHAVLTE